MIFLFILQGDLYYIFILQSLHLCTGYTDYKDIYSNLVSADIIDHIMSPEEEYYPGVLRGYYI